MTSKEELAEFTQSLRKIFPATPLQKSLMLSDRYDAEIYLKREDLSPVRSYKIRGAYSYFRHFLESQELMVCASAGNHSQGFAFCCKYFKRPGKIFMPITTPAQKINRTKFFGGEWITIELVGDTFDECSEEAMRFVDNNKGLIVPPFDHEYTIFGQASVGVEVIDQMKEGPTAIISPVGGGGLSAGISICLSIHSPKTKLIGVEPESAPSLKKAFEAGYPVKLPHISNFVDGAAVAKIGDIPWKYLKESIEKNIFICPENRICGTILEFMTTEGMILEPAGALAIDALQDIFKTPELAKELKGKKIVAIVSGGNFDIGRLPDLENRWELFKGLRRFFIVQFPQRPGALREFLDCLGKDDDVIRFEYLKKNSKTFGSVLIGLQSKSKENFAPILDNMKKKKWGYMDVTNNELLSGFVL